MIPTARIATGFAESLLKSARPSTDPELIVAEAVQRGLRLGLSLRRTPTVSRRRALLFEKEVRHGP